MPEQPARSPGADPDRLVDVVLEGARVLVDVAARSLEDAGEDLSPAQYQVLLILASGGPHRLVDLAMAMDVSPSNATRMADRLVHKRLARRQRQAGDRREVKVALTPAGRDLVGRVTAARRVEIARLLAAMTPAGLAALEVGLRSLSQASPADRA